MLMEDVFCIMKGFHVTRLWISQVDLHIRHKAVERADPTHLAYDLSMKPMKVDDGVVEFLRVERKKGMETLRVFSRTKSWRTFCFLYLSLRTKNNTIFQKCWIV